MRRGQGDGVDGRVQREEGAHVEPVGVDGHRHGLQPGVEDRAALAAPPRVLDGDAPGAALAQRRPHEREPLGDARGDHDVARPGGDAPGAPEVARQRRPQRRGAARVAVVEAGVRDRPQRPPERRLPRRARERREVGTARAQVVGRRRRPGRDLLLGGTPDPLGSGRRPRGHGRAGATAGDEEPLGRELGVRLHHHPARDAELPGQRAAGRQGGARPQAAVADAAAHALLELVAQRIGARAVGEDDVEVHWSGRPYLDWPFPGDRLRS